MRPTGLDISGALHEAGLDLPYRGPFGGVRPPALQGLPLPPGPMPSHHQGRPLKAWRYVAVFCPELMLCAASIRIGRTRQSFWAVWEREAEILSERTTLGRGALSLLPGRIRLDEPRHDAELDLSLDEQAGLEAVCRSGRSYAWTRKQGGIAVQGRVRAGSREYPVTGRAVVDDTAGYYARHTAWRWSAGVGSLVDGREVAWNLVAGVNDPPRGSERTVWVAGVPQEPPPSRFAPDLAGVDGLRFHSEAVRHRRENLLLLRSTYRQPFGTFSGVLPGGLALREGYGVMEEHDVHW